MYGTGNRRRSWGIPASTDDATDNEYLVHTGADFDRSSVGDVTAIIPRAYGRVRDIDADAVHHGALDEAANSQHPVSVLKTQEEPSCPESRNPRPPPR